MAKVFISYSRKDTEFAKKLTGELQKSDYDFWIDWEGIPPTVDWWREIEKGIEEADIFLFIISPDSATSKICGQEIDTAVKNGKRIIPVVTREIEWEDTPPQLGHLNYIFFSREDDFDTATKKLLTAIQTDYEWAATHRRFQVKALEWERSEKENSFLLRGKDLQDAEEQLAANTSKEPHPTDLQREYIHKSRQIADRQRRITTGISIVGIIALAVLAVYGFVQAGLATNAQATAEANLVVANTAQANAESAQATAVANEEEALKQATIARAGELAAQSNLFREDNLQLSLLLGLESFYTADNFRTRQVLLDNVVSNPKITQFFSGNAMSAAFSPDGKTFVAGGADGKVILWDIESLQIIGKPWSGHTDAVRFVAFSPDGKTVASAGDDAQVILWNVSTGQRIGKPLSGRYSATFSPDSKTVATVGDNDQVILWDVSTGEMIGKPLNGNLEYNNISYLEFSPDGQTLATVGDYFLLWDVATGQQIGQAERVDAYSMAFSPDGKTLLIGSWEGYNDWLWFWDLEAGEWSEKLISEQNGNGPLSGKGPKMFALAYSPDGKMFASGSEDSSIMIWDAETRQPLFEQLEGHSLSIHTLTFSPDSQTLISGAGDDQVVFWDTATGEMIGQPLQSANLAVYSQDGKRFMSFENDAFALWEIEKEHSIAQVFAQSEKFSESVVFSPDGQTIASGDYNGIITLFDAATGEPIFKTIGGDISSLAFSPNGQTFASGLGDGTIILWNGATGAPIGNPMSGHSDDVEGMTYSPNGQILVSSGRNDGQVIMWDTNTGQMIGQPLLGYEWGSRVAFSPDGQLFATSGNDGTVVLRDGANGQQMGEPLTMENAVVVNSLLFSLDGKILAAGGDDELIYIWDVATRQLIGVPLFGHEDGVEFMAFSPDGKTLASSSRYNTIILWDVMTGQPIGESLSGKPIAVTPVPEFGGGGGGDVSELAFKISFSPDGKTLLAADWGFAWDLESRQQLEGTLDLLDFRDSCNGVVSPDGQKFLCENYGGARLVLWDLVAKQPIHELNLPGHASTVNSLAFSPDGQMIASSASNDSTVRLWDAATGESISLLAGHSSSVEHVAFSPDGSTILSAGCFYYEEDCAFTVIKWDAATGNPISTHQLSEFSEFSGVSFHPDGNTIAFGMVDGTIVLWDLAAEKPLGEPLAGFTEGVSSLAFSPDGLILATAGAHNGVILLWDWAAGKPISQPLRGHELGVDNLVFSPDGLTLVSSGTRQGIGGYAGVLRLWDVQTGQPLGEPLNASSFTYDYSVIVNMVFSPDGLTLFSYGNLGGGDSTTLLWNVDSQVWVTQTCQRVGRNFTQEEWNRYFPNEEYRKTCNQWPLE